MAMRFNGTMGALMPMILLISLTLSGLGWTPHQTAPNPRAVTARSMFSVAAEQSWTQKREASGSPQTEMQRVASFSILACWCASASLFRVSLSVTTMKCHGFRLEAEGAAIADSMRFLISSSVIGSFVYFRMLLLDSIVLISSLLILSQYHMVINVSKDLLFFSVLILFGCLGRKRY